MKRVNKLGPTVLADNRLPAELDAKEIVRIASEQMVIDVGSSSAFATAHAVGTINIPMKYLAGWAGWLVDYEKPVYLLLPREELAEATRILQKIGIENIAGFFDADKIEAAGLRTESYSEQTPQQLAASIESGGVVLVDVRGESEWIESHIPQAQRCFLASLPKKLNEFDGDCTLVFQCRSGGRSAIAAGLAKAAGVRNVINMSGGINAWMEAGLPTDADTSEVPGPNHSASTSEAACQGQAVFWNAKCPSRPKEATLST